MTSDSSDNISRREVLAGATGTGLLGAMAAGSTSAVVSDDVVFEGSNEATGTIDLKRCWSPADAEDCTPTDGSALSIDLGNLAEGDSGSGSIRLRLPDDGDNNPGWLWMRSTCPARPCGPFKALYVTLWYDMDCDGTRGEDEPVLQVDGSPIEEMRLCEALTLLAEGTQLDAGPSTDLVEPLQPGQDLCLGLEWRVNEKVCTVQDSELVTLDFVAQQRRHRPEPESPWNGRVCNVNCGAACRDDCYPGSFVAFCLDDTGDLQKEDVAHLSWTPEMLRWRTVKPIDCVVLKYGQTYELNAPKDGFDPGVTYEFWRGDHLMNTSRVEELAIEPADPCPDWGPDSDGCGVRYNFEEATWDDVCRSPKAPRGGGRD